MKWTMLLLLVGLIIDSCSKSGHKGHHDDSHSNILKTSVETYYTCSMHPTIKEQGPGKCPICHMNLSKIEIEKESIDYQEGDKGDIKSEESHLFYCEADDDVMSEVPGECPLDGTPMIKKVMPRETQNVVAQVKLRKSQVKHFKADLFSVTTMKMQKKIRLLGTLLKSEDKESNIPARIDGRVEKVFVSF
jgi:Cu(I)/Ag(I) efflux system membrane fusion protein